MIFVLVVNDHAELCYDVNASFAHNQSPANIDCDNTIANRTLMVTAGVYTWTLAA